MFFHFLKELGELLIRISVELGSYNIATVSNCISGKIKLPIYNVSNLRLRAAMSIIAKSQNPEKNFRMEMKFLNCSYRSRVTSLKLMELLIVIVSPETHLYLNLGF